MAGRGRGTLLTRPAWMQTPRNPPTTAPSSTTSTATATPQQQQQKQQQQQQQQSNQPTAPPSTTANPTHQHRIPAATTSTAVTDWTKTHAADGRPYWYSRSTGKTTWIDPATSQTTPPASNAANLDARARSDDAAKPRDGAMTVGAVSSVWREVVANDGRKYYYNRVTKKTQWHRPPDMVDAGEEGNASRDVDSGPATAASGGTTTVDPSVGTEGVAVSVVPKGSAQAIAHKADDSVSQDAQEEGITQHAANAQSVSKLPEGWAKHLTSDGRPYYYHARTRKTRWKPPVGDENAATTVSPTSTSAVSPEKSGSGRSRNANETLRGTKRPLSPSGSSQVLDGARNGEDDLPAGWRRHTAPDGRVYYYHAQSRKTSWTLPTQETSEREDPLHSPSPKRVKIESPAGGGDGVPSGEAVVRNVIVRRPRDGDGKPLTDKAAEAYFVKRAALRKAAGVSEADVSEDADMDADVSTRLLPFKERTERFYAMLRDNNVDMSTPWLTVMSRCAHDKRYSLLETYGARRDAWLKFRERLSMMARRAALIETRKKAEALVELCEEVFKDEGGHITSVNRCSPVNVKRFEEDERLSAVPERDRADIVDAFFVARVRKFEEERGRRRREVKQRMGEALERRILPSLRGEGENNEVNGEGNSTNEGKRDLEGSDAYFTERTPFRELERFLMGLEGHEMVDQGDISDVIRRWHRKVDVLWDERLKRRKALERENRNKFRSGVFDMLLKGTIPFTARWKDVADVVAKEDFAKAEDELGGRPGDLYEQGVRMFEERVQKYRDTFKRLIREAGVEIKQSTTVEELGKVENLKRFMEETETSVVRALLVDRQRKEHRRRMKEKDRLLGEFRDMMSGSDVVLGLSFEQACEAWKDLTLYKALMAVGAEQNMRLLFEECVRVKEGREHQRLKRHAEMGAMGGAGMGMGMGVGLDVGMHSSVGSGDGFAPLHGHGFVGGQRAKRPRVSEVVLGNGPFSRNAPAAAPSEAREEENGWTAVVSKKEAMTEKEKLAEKERQKREILESLETDKSLTHSQV